MHYSNLKSLLFDASKTSFYWLDLTTSVEAFDGVWSLVFSVTEEKLFIFPVKNVCMLVSDAQLNFLPDILESRGPPHGRERGETVNHNPGTWSGL